jgi:hypothetical protein
MNCQAHLKKSMTISIKILRGNIVFLIILEFLHFFIYGIGAQLYFSSFGRTRGAPVGYNSIPCLESWSKLSK